MFQILTQILVTFAFFISNGSSELVLSFDDCDNEKSVCIFKNKTRSPNEPIRFEGMPRGTIEAIHFKYSSLKTLPRDLFKGHSFTEIYATNCEIGEIENLENLTLDHLHHLGLSSNMLTTIKSDWIISENLREVDLSNNLISKIEDCAFCRLPMLMSLDLSNNRLDNFDFQWRNELSNVNLSGNRIAVVAEKNFLNRYFLSLDLSHNDLFAFDAKNVKTIILDHNPRLSSVSIGLYVSILSANSCNISTIIMTEISMLGLFGYFFMSNLFLSNNIIQNVSFLQHVDLTDMRQIDLSNNPINIMDPHAFSIMEHLELLYLQNCGLTTLPTFQKNLQLKALDLSNNYLSSSEVESLYTIASLEELFIDGNQLTTLDGKQLLSSFPNLNTIELSNNNWSCPILANITKLLNETGVRLVVDEIDRNTETDNIMGIPCNQTGNASNVTRSLHPLHSEGAHFPAVHETNGESISVQDVMQFIEIHYNKTRDRQMVKDLNLKDSIINEMGSEMKEVKCFLIVLICVVIVLAVYLAVTRFTLFQKPLNTTGVRDLQELL